MTELDRTQDLTDRETQAIPVCKRIKHGGHHKNHVPIHSFLE